jgi:hypothetical protein
MINICSRKCITSNWKVRILHSCASCTPLLDCYVIYSSYCQIVPSFGLRSLFCFVKPCLVVVNLISCLHCALLGCYAESIVDFLTTFRDNLSVPSSWFKNAKQKLVPTIRSLYREECGRWKLVSSGVSANRVVASVRMVGSVVFLLTVCPIT